MAYAAHAMAGVEPVSPSTAHVPSNSPMQWDLIAEHKHRHAHKPRELKRELTCGANKISAYPQCADSQRIGMALNKTRTGIKRVSGQADAVQQFGRGKTPSICHRGGYFKQPSGNVTNEQGCYEIYTNHLNQCNRIPDPTAKRKCEQDALITYQQCIGD